jgi:hypothetical protein
MDGAMALRKRLLLLFVLCLSLALLQGGAAQAVDERPAKRHRLGPTAEVWPAPRVAGRVVIR